jgi:hypothetical protein
LPPGRSSALPAREEGDREKTVRGADKKKLLILAGASVALVVVLVLRFVMPVGGSGASASASEKGGGQPVGVLDSDPKHLSTVAKIARARTQTAYTVRDLRDPMVPLLSGGSAHATGSDEGASDGAAPVHNTEASLPPMSLYGIIWDPANPIAMIDGMDLCVGDRIKGARIVEIGIDRVVLSYRSKDYVLTVD